MSKNQTPNIVAGKARVVAMACQNDKGHPVTTAA